MTIKLNEIIIPGKGLFICHSGGSQLSVNIKPFPNSPFAHSPLLCLPLHYPPLHLVTQHCTVLHYCNTFSHTTLYVLHYIAIHSVAQHNTECMSHSNVWHYIPLHSVTLQYSAVDLCGILLICYFALPESHPCMSTNAFAMHRLRMFQNLMDLADISNPCKKVD